MATDRFGSLHRSTERGVFAVLLVLSALLYAMYFVHLRADYPSVLPAVDWARYTDEGWYGGAALHHAQTGQWFTPNGFNPAVALPVWPLLLRAWFALTGVGMVSARVLAVLMFGASNVLLYALLRPLTGRVLAVAAVLLTLADPFCYGFNRLALPESLVSLEFLLALWLAWPRSTARRGSLLRSGGVGLVLTATVLTKTTAVLLAPSVLYLLWQAARIHRQDDAELAEAAWHGALRRAVADRSALVPVAVAAGVALGAWALYFLLLVRPHYAADFHHLFAVNAGKAHGRILLQVMARAVGDATWMGGLLWALTLLLLAASLRYLRELWRVPLFGSAVLALVLPIAWIGWHTWFLPHYYLSCVAPMMMAIALGVHALARRAHRGTATLRLRMAHTAAMLVLEAAFAMMLLVTLSIAAHPQYTWWSAAQDIAARMRADTPQEARPKLLAASADDVALFTGVQGANPEWPIGGLPALVAQEKPAWYGGYLSWDAKRIAEMQRLVPLREVARYRIQPDPDHQVFVLYRVVRPESAAAPAQR
ncbi:glycosyltransferase family 39 protein [Terriglobus aquaticus]|uniref:ArnT family glycosyltransferase n=1 Tax=Terriglobus aquaticus TaxID=940139 RepID=A0ABW9KRG6_9BACT|nr:glycosyltransferase family 39 protein [Terriglobus aquaticus]